METLVRRAFLFGTAATMLAATTAFCDTSTTAVRAAVRGPKKRLFVASFESLANFDFALGGAAGDALAAQLVSVLTQMPEFDVVDRSDLASLQVEQGLGASHGSVAGIAEHDAQILGAQVIVKGYVTAFDPGAKSDTLGIGIGGSNLLGSAGTQSTHGVIAMDVRLTDTTSGLLIGATHVEEAVNSRSFNTAIGGPTAGVSQQSVNNDVVGQVTRAAFIKVSEFVRQRLVDLVWTGLVAEADGNQIFINVGGDNNVSVGDEFAVSRVSRRIIDPSSGQLLGVTEAALGRIRVVSVQAKFSICAPVTSALGVQKGDIVRFVAR